MLAKKNNIRVTTALRMTSSRAEKVLWLVRALPVLKVLHLIANTALNNFEHWL